MDGSRFEKCIFLAILLLFALMISPSQPYEVKERPVSTFPFKEFFMENVTQQLMSSYSCLNHDDRSRCCRCDDKCMEYGDCCIDYMYGAAWTSVVKKDVAHIANYIR